MDANVKELDEYFTRLADYTSSLLDQRKQMLAALSKCKRSLGDLGAGLNAFSLEVVDDDIAFSQVEGDRNTTELREEFEKAKENLARELEAKGVLMDAHGKPLAELLAMHSAAQDCLEEIILYCEAIRV